jgi:deoxyribonuclease V
MVGAMCRWPSEATELERLQSELALIEAEQLRWSPRDTADLVVGAVFATGPRPRAGMGSDGDRAWVAACAWRAGTVVDATAVRGRFSAPYRPGLLALREGALLARALSRLRLRPDVVLVDGTGRDHPRRAGLALHLGWALGLPTIGVTDRPLCDPSASVPVTSREGVRPIRVHAGWRVDLPVAVRVLGPLLRARTPEPLREARRLARTARAANSAPP